MDVVNTSLQKINSFAFEAQKHNYLFSYNENLILISKLDLNVNLAKLMPSISVFLKKLSESSIEEEIKEFSVFDFSKELSKIDETLKQEELKKEKYSIIKDLVRHVSN